MSGLTDCLRIDAQMLTSRRLYSAAKDCDDAADTIERMTTALMSCLAVFESMERGSTHWEGCEDRHPRCSLIRNIREAVSTWQGQCIYTPGLDCYSDQCCQYTPSGSEAT